MAAIRERKQSIILKAAGEVFASNGYDGTKIVDIANKINVPKANIFYYFTNKEKLYNSVLESFIQPLLLATKPFDEYDDPATALTDYIKLKIEISQQHPFASKVFASEMLRGAPHLSKDIIEQLTQQTQSACAKLQSWVDQGLMDDINPLHLLFSLWASTQTYADFNWQIKLHLNTEELTDSDYQLATQTLTKIILKGCGISAKKLT
ncbi:TetR family transcriptional regulator C-terminal domain-containing protein [Gammaproteobacteria bacterium AS21]